jgi:hypothetical protein
MKQTDPIPPGATRKALDQPLTSAGGPPGSGAGARHMAGDTGPELAGGEDNTGNNWSYTGDPGDEDDPGNEVLRGGDEEERRGAYGDPSGGAVGGTPAEGRASGGRLRPGQGLAPGEAHRGVSTVGADPSSES